MLFHKAAPMSAKPNKKGLMINHAPKPTLIQFKPPYHGGRTVRKTAKTATKTPTTTLFQRGGFNR